MFKLNSFSEINDKVVKLILVSIGFLLIINMLFLNIISENIANDFYNSKSDDIFKDLNQFADALKGSAKRVSENEDIISILETNKSFDDLSDDEIEDMFNEIDL